MAKKKEFKFMGDGHKEWVYVWATTRKEARKLLDDRKKAAASDMAYVTDANDRLI